MEYDEERSTKLNHLLVLKDEIAIIENRIEPHDCGHMITTVNFLSGICYYGNVISYYSNLLL